MRTGKWIIFRNWKMLAFEQHIVLTFSWVLFFFFQFFLVLLLLPIQSPFISFFFSSDHSKICANAFTVNIKFMRNKEKEIALADVRRNKIEKKKKRLEMNCGHDQGIDFFICVFLFTFSSPLFCVALLLPDYLLNEKLDVYRLRNWIFFSATENERDNHYQ